MHIHFDNFWHFVYLENSIVEKMLKICLKKQFTLHFQHFQHSFPHCIKRFSAFSTLFSTMQNFQIICKVVYITKNIPIIQSMHNRDVHFLFIKF
ncbi:MAG: hypothetical protein DBY14_04835 [Escherichia coli]|nr:MAG: hypothetical protein DBY14_04835 [Escherichia coli]